MVLPDTTNARDCGITCYYKCHGLWYYLVLLMPWIVVLPVTTNAMDYGIPGITIAMDHGIGWYY